MMDDQTTSTAWKGTEDYDDVFEERLDQAIMEALGDRYRCAVCGKAIMYVRVNNRWQWMHKDKSNMHKVVRK